eukprot:CAMPEP_0181435374 /NCGR_PEP_ID=MMETSP1110-20121109/20300_1 /TAXON_ID=174948 /ORGANISM="Symbiodinium sp., Strain CCMP421" /LENGTH=509 /DNA_ID=CAMNT_0023558907 /DNA_START=48 /DNA_END=1577 /DNA_ORIENTATION=-
MISGTESLEAQLHLISDFQEGTPREDDAVEDASPRMWRRGLGLLLLPVCIGCATLLLYKKPWETMKESGVHTEGTKSGFLQANSMNDSRDEKGEFVTLASTSSTTPTTSTKLPELMVDFLGSAVDEVAPDQQSAGDAICNAAQPMTEPGWSPRTWDISLGDRIACESRNRVKDKKYRTIRYDNWDRNWCWIGVKEMCHENLKYPRSWTHYRQEAFKKGMAPDPELTPFDGLTNPEVCDGARHGVPKPFLHNEEAVALDWFQRNVKVYVLNLPKFYNRWDVISARLAELKIYPERVIGVDMQEPGMYQTAKWNGWIPQWFNLNEAQAMAKKPENDMGMILGTVGCAAAHFKAQDAVLRDNPKLGLVLEDDSYLLDDFVVRLWRIVTQELPCDWEVLQLLGRCPFGKCVSEHLARIQPDGNEPENLCHAGVNWGFHGVLYRTERLAEVQKLWQKRVFDAEIPHCLDLDVGLASISDQVGYYSVPSSQQPPLIREMDMGSVRASINLGFKVG